MPSHSERPDPSGAVRLNRFLARCGVASRRACDDLILEGAVEVNGSVVTDLATTVEKEDQVKVNGIKVKPKPAQAILLHKPKGLTCSQSDEQAKETIYSCLPPKLHHLQHVGRLDRDTEGLLVLTNDGDLAQELAHPSHKREKEYLVTLHEAVPNEVLDRLLSGVRLSEGQVRFDAMIRVSARRVRVVLSQGYKRQIRRMFATLGLKVKKLIRIRMASLWLDDIEPGRWRFLEGPEIEMLRQNPKRVDKSLYYRPTRKGGRTLAKKKARQAIRKRGKKSDSASPRRPKRG